MPSAKYIAIIVSKEIPATDLATVLYDHDSAFCDKEVKFAERPFGKRYSWCIGQQERVLAGVKTQITSLCLISLYPIKKAKLRDLTILMPGWYLAFANDAETSKRDIVLAFGRKMCVGSPPVAESTFWDENLGEMSDKLGQMFTKWSTGASSPSGACAFGAAFEASVIPKKVAVTAPKSPRTAAAIAEEDDLENLFWRLFTV